MTAAPLHSVSVAGVAIDEAGRVLVIRRRDNGQWQAPGGVLELGESLECGVVREVREETGVDVEVQYLTGVYKNVVAHVVALVYRCRPIGGAVTSTDESAEAAWISVDEAVGRMSAAFAVRITDALARGPAASRVHDGSNLL